MTLSKNLIKVPLKPLKLEINILKFDRVALVSFKNLVQLKPDSHYLFLNISLTVL